MTSPTVDAAALIRADRAGAPVLTRSCHTAVMVDDLRDRYPDVAQKIEAALAAEDVPTGLIVAVLAKHGLPARAENINRHRRRLTGGNYACKCPVPSREANA